VAVVGENLRLALMAEMGEVQGWVNGHKRFLLQLGRDPELFELTVGLLSHRDDLETLSRSRAVEEISRFFTEKRSELGAINYAIVDYNDINVAAGDRSLLGQENRISRLQPRQMDRIFAGEALFIAGLRSPGVGSDDDAAVRDEVSGNYFAVPIRSAIGTVLAVLVERIADEGQLSRILAQNSIGMSGKSLVVNPFGVVVARSGVADIASNGDSGSPPGLRLLREEADALSRPMAVQLGSYQEESGEAVLGAWVWNRSLDLGFAIEIDLKQALTNFDTLRLRLWGITLISLVLTIVSVVVTGLLGERAIAVMRSYRQALEQKVQERTMALKESQERQELALQGGELGLWDVNLETGKTVINQRYGEIYGYRTDACTEDREEWVSRIHPEDRERVLAQGRAYRDGSESLYESSFRIMRKDGEIRWVISKGAAVKWDSDGSVLRMVGTVLDITEKQQTLEALQVEEERIRLLLEAVGEGIFGVGEDGLVNFINPAATRMLGYSAQEVMGECIHSLIHHTRADGTPYPLEECPMRRSLTYGTHHTVENECLWRKDGTSFPVQYSSVPIEKRGRIAGAVVVFHDVTQQQELVATLERARNVAEEATRAKSEFLANMSHEIRTPMNAIIGMSYLALKSGLNLKQRDYVNKIHTAANSLLRIINDILDFSKIEADKLEIEYLPFSLNQSLDHLRNLVTVEVERKGLVLAITLDPRLPDAVVGDPHRLGQILLNLTNNAIKFTEKGGVTLRVDFDQADESNLLVHFAVSDSGIGMSERQLSRLFQSFSQADASTTRKYGGTGLGLTISKRLTEMMGGEMWVESVDGEGSTFHFTLPFEIAAAGAVISGGGGAPLETAMVSFSGNPRILLVEDNEINSQVAQELLEMVRLEVTVVENGQLAVERVEEEAFDLVLMDIQMPVLDGYGATQKIRERFSTTRLPVIAMTANAMGEDRERALEAGMNDHIPKPIDPATLYQVLQRWLPQRGERGGEEALQSDTDQPVHTSLSEEDQLQALIGAGLDCHSAVDRLAGNRSLYFRLLQKFIDNHGQTVTEVETALAEGDGERAIRLAHTLKGLAATIGAPTLQEVALRLEEALKRGGEEPPSSQIKALQGELDPLVSLLTKTLNAEKVVAQSLPNLSGEALRRRLREVADQIEQYDSTVVERVEALLQEVTEPALLTPLKRLQNSLREYNFDEAEEILHQITARI
ncbi:MAG: PAS domain S-box protein, partial [Gammaproteobacteria bacterium]|nr:PAS domain S-box protein [Gammaproteobacteria bacterium]